MRGPIALLLVLILAPSGMACAESVKDQQRPSRIPAPNSSIYVDVLTATFYPLFQDSVDVNVGTIWAFDRYFQVIVNDFLTYERASRNYSNETQVGLLLNPFGSYLDGLALAAIVATKGYSDPSIPMEFSVIPEIVLEWAFQFGLYLGAYLGYGYTFAPRDAGSLRYGVTIGVAYSSVLQN